MSIPTNRNDAHYKSDLIKHIKNNLLKKEVNDLGLHLILACINNDIDLIDRLLLEGADIEFTTAEDDFSPLGVAISLNHLAVLKGLVTHKPLLHQVNLKNNLPIEVVGY